MLHIVFHPESDNFKYIKAAAEYQDVWNSEGENIVQQIETISGLHFAETLINAVVFRGASYSKPLRLRDNISLSVKKRTLIHELCHRLLSGNYISTNQLKETNKLEHHKNINLVLYDVLSGLYGEEFANEQVEIESQWQPIYQEAWDWALSKTKEERKTLFEKLQKNISVDHFE